MGLMKHLYTIEAETVPLKEKIKIRKKKESILEKDPERKAFLDKLKFVKPKKIVEDNQLMLDFYPWNY